MGNPEGIQEQMKDILSGDQELTEETYDGMMKEWMSGGAQMQGLDNMMSEWGKTWDQDA